MCNSYAFYAPGLQAAYEILKLIYHYWPLYMNCPYEQRPRVFPHCDLYQALYTIKDTLLMMGTLSREQIMKMCKQKHTPYLNFQLLGCLPLLDNGVVILEHITQIAGYADAEEFIYYAMERFTDKQAFWPVFKRIIGNAQRAVHGCSYGSMDLSAYQLFPLIKMFEREGLSVLDDSELHHVFYKQDDTPNSLLIQIKEL